MIVPASKTRRTGSAARTLLALVTSTVLAAACGSTVPQSAFRNRGAAGGLSANGENGLSLPTGQSGLGGPTTGAGGGAGGLPSGSGQLGGPSGGPVQQALGPGITASTIYIGAGYNINQAAANAAVGGGGAGGSDIRDAYNVMINLINSQGGVKGRKLSPVYYGVDATSSQTADQQAQAACAKWTQDNKVFIILGGQQPADRECAKKAGTVLYWSPAGSNTLPETFTQYPHFVEITGLNLVRAGQVTIDGMRRQGYFNRGARIGIVAWDDPAYRAAVTRGYVPALKSHGLGVAVDPIYIHAPQNIQDLAGATADVNNAVLKLSTRGVDHVMLLDGPVGVCAGGCLGLEFLQRAKAQHYQPRYGMNENNLPIEALDAGFYPPDQLRGTIAVLWGDGNKSQDAGWRTNAARDRCEKIMREHGVEMGDVNSHGAAIEACEEMWFLLAVVAKLGTAPLTVDNFMAGVNALGGSYGPVSAYGTHFSPTQHDGISAARNVEFVDSCTCFRYTSDPYSVV